MGKPTLDLIIFTTQLATSLGAWGTIGLFANYGFTVWILKKATPAFGKLKTVEASMEGEYRSALGRIGREAEEVAYVCQGSEGAMLPDLSHRHPGSTMVVVVKGNCSGKLIPRLWRTSIPSSR
jgi:ABC-type uncharacterized transport system fused permease/ATPase subunit